jgi:hypothetical protein
MSAIRTIFFIFCIIAFTLGFQTGIFGQNEVQNPHVRHVVEKVDSNYIIKYTFKDQFDVLQTYTIYYPIELTDQKIDKFGIPNWLFEPYIDNEYNRSVRLKEIEKGLFTLKEDIIEVDKNAVINYYAEDFCRSIAGLIVGSLKEQGNDNRLNRIETAMCFVQDIPYAIPVFKNNERHFGGVTPPPKLLIDHFGDCDSKAILFAGILIYLIPAEDILFLNQKDHLLTAVKGDPKESDTYIEFAGQSFLIAETAGPGRRLLGEKGNYYKGGFIAETVEVDQPVIFPVDYNSTISKSITAKNARNELILKNCSNREFRFQLSFNRENWEALYLAPNETEKYIFDSEQEIYLRFRKSTSLYRVYNLQTGQTYSVYWNQNRKLWEVAN